MTIEQKVAAYYSDKIATFGATPQGVDWNSSQSQQLRFEQLSRILNTSSAFSLFDIGCGYGAYYDHLSASVSGDFLYTGYDISAQMIAAAKERLGHKSNALFKPSLGVQEQADFVVASGIFNVKVGTDDARWLDYVLTTLEQMNQSALKGFAFNCLTLYSDEDKMSERLYYGDPLKLFDFCKRNFSKEVALLHDYGLYEFTILVRKLL